MDEVGERNLHDCYLAQPAPSRNADAARRPAFFALAATGEMRKIGTRSDTRTTEPLA